jgi:hypothetical protein
LDLLRPKTGVFELSTKTVDNFVDFFLTLPPGKALVRILSLCRNIKQQMNSFKFKVLNKRLCVKGFPEFIFGERQNSVHKSSFAAHL